MGGKTYVIAQDKHPFGPFLLCVVGICNERLHVQVGIQFHQAVVQLIHYPHRFEGACKCGVQRCEVSAFVVAEDAGRIIIG